MSLDHVFQPIKLGVHIVPGIWRYMLPEEVFYFRVDPERKSSCFDCPQVKAKGFHPSVRCCTYIPRVPNFLLGMALLATDTQKMVEDFVTSGYAIPEGSQHSHLQLIASLEHVSPSDSLKSNSIVCPFLDLKSKQCRMYSFRSGVCSTFFCIHDDQVEGREFWEHLQDFVSQIETALSQWVLSEIGFDVEAYFARFNLLSAEIDASSAPLTKAWSQMARKILFAEWYGREVAMFKRCAELVIENKNNLYELASKQKLLQAKTFDDTARQTLREKFSAHLVAESLPVGEPMPIKDIWYSVQLANRNLQLKRISEQSDS